MKTTLPLLCNAASNLSTKKASSLFRPTSGKAPIVEATSETFAAVGFSFEDDKGTGRLDEHLREASDRDIENLEKQVKTCSADSAKDAEPLPQCYFSWCMCGTFSSSCFAPYLRE